jgi:hypothetical protein
VVRTDKPLPIDSSVAIPKFSFFVGEIIKSYLLKSIFFGINRDGSLPDNNGKFKNDIRVSQLLSKIFLNLSILIALFNAIKNKKKFIKQKKEIYFIIIITLNLFPHLLVWATSKHLVGITNVAIIYLINFLFENKSVKI